MKDRVGQTWNFPLRCEDGIRLTTAIVVETLEPYTTDEPGDYHRMLILDSSSSTEHRQSGSLLTIQEPSWSQWNTMSSWTRLG